MTEEPLAIGAVLLVGGILMRIIAPTVSELFQVNIGGWGWLLIIVGLVVIVVRLLAMSGRY